jgi:esterase/lipase superfamily enzyme
MLQEAVLVIVLAGGLAACAGRPEDVMSPVVTTAPGTSRVDMLVATTRRPAPSAGELFSGERGGTVSFANVVVSIPPDGLRKIGDVQWPNTSPGNPATDFVTVKADRLDRVKTGEWIHTKTARMPKHRVLVFVHGFNNKFDDAVFRFAQIVHDADAEAVPVLFTWPSRGSLFAYGYDRESTNLSRDGLEQVLNMLSKDPAVSEVTVLAHSMGSWLTLEVLRQITIRDRHIPAKIRDVMLAAPDVDVDVFGNEIADMREPRPNFTLLISRDDNALAVSRHVWGSAARLGAVDVHAEPYKSQLAAERITVVDLTHRASDDGLNHGKFSSSPELVRLLGGRLGTGQILDDWHEGIGDKVVAATTGGAASFGTAAGLAVAAPISVIDPATREHLADDVNELETELQDTASSGADGQAAR